MIKFQNVNVTFKQNKKLVEAVKNVSFDIEKGSIYGIVGGSGAGKSTLLRTVNKLQETTSGEVFVNGKDITKIKGKELRNLRKNIGMIFQHFNLAESKTVAQNISFILESSGWKKDAINKRVDELLDFVNLSDKKNVYPSRLSGGQKQRVAIARALANNTEILLCDEPTSALDAETTVSVLDLLEKVNKELGVTIVIITHELDVVKRICGKVAVMDRGQVVEIGSVYKVFTKPESEFTKQLIANSNNFDIPESVLKNMEGDILELTYLGQNAGEAVLSEITAEYNVRFNILHGKIEYIGDKPLGILYVNLLGDKATRKKVKNILAEKVSNVEVLKNA